MSGQTSQCAYCGAALPIAFYGVDAWRVGNGFVCNEFCADGFSPSVSEVKATLEAKRASNEFRSLLL
jgi:hypothetical protein